METLEINQTRILNKSKVSTRVEVITPELAEEYLKHNISNRKLNGKLKYFYMNDLSYKKDTQFFICEVNSDINNYDYNNTFYRMFSI